MDNSSKQGVQQVKHQVQLLPAAPSPSVSSSPSHEFSFTISLETPATMATPVKLSEKNNNKKQPSFAIDLSPADEIFSHGHLLPLHLLSRVPVSPRSSINSLDSFTLPIHELSQDNDTNNNHSNSTTTNDYRCTNTDHHRENEEKGRRNSRFFSFLGWRKLRGTEEEGKSTGKSKFDIREVAKRCMRLVKPFLAMMMHRRRRNGQVLHRRRQPYSSFSGNLMMRRSKEELRGRRRREEYYSSAPSSMMTSRTNSGLLVGSGSGSVTPTKSDSTMEELQAAIQAAIAHCKNTLATDHQINLP